MTSYRSSWERKDFGFFTGSSCAEPHPEDPMENIIRRLENMRSKAEYISGALRDMTERRRALNERIEKSLARSRT